MAIWKTLARSALGVVNLPLPVRTGGRTFTVPLLGGNIAWPSEPWMVEVLRALLPRAPGLFVDVGVNLGQTLLKVKALDPARDYVGFEPNPVCVAYVSRLVRMNDLPSCTIVPAALGEHPALLNLDLYGSESNPGASLVPGFRRADRRTASIPVAALSPEMVPAVQHGPVGMIKIDVEGGELDVMTAFAAIVARDRPVILLEVLPCYGGTDSLRAQRQDDLQRLVATLGYEIRRVRKHGSHVAGYDRVADFGLHSDMQLCDYVLTPAGRDVGI